MGWDGKRRESSEQKGGAGRKEGGRGKERDGGNEMNGREEIICATHSTDHGHCNYEPCLLICPREHVTC